MTFQPVVPFGGLLGWQFLQRTRDAQEEAYQQSAPVERSTDYFRENIGSIRTAQELVDDRRLLEVALGAFGLSEDINNKFFIRKVLEEGVEDRDAFANQLADKRYFAMADAFRFDLSPPNTVLSGFPGRIIEAYETRSFEAAVGDIDENMRLALGLERELSDLLDRRLTKEGTWFTILGNPPLRAVFEKAFGLPSQFGAIDVDRQFEEITSRARQAFGTDAPDILSDPDVQEELIRKFLLRAEIDAQATRTVRGAVALSLLQSALPATAPF